MAMGMLLVVREAPTSTRSVVARQISSSPVKGSPYQRQAMLQLGSFTGQTYALLQLSDAAASENSGCSPGGSRILLLQRIVEVQTGMSSRPWVQHGQRSLVVFSFLTRAMSIRHVTSLDLEARVLVVL